MHFSQKLDGVTLNTTAETRIHQSCAIVPKLGDFLFISSGNIVTKFWQNCFAKGLMHFVDCMTRQVKHLL